jgi:putative sterol carrier protein
MATGQDPVSRIEAAVEMTDDELADELPAILDAVEGQIEELMLEEPALFGQVVGRMGEMDVSEFASDHPGTVERFQAMLWTGMDLLVQFSPDVQESIRQDVTVTFDATDAPMTGSLVLDADAGTVQGQTDLVDDPAIEIEGPANVLVGLITGGTDPVEGFMRGEFTMRGDVNRAMALAETMEKLTAKLPA